MHRLLMAGCAMIMLACSSSTDSGTPPPPPVPGSIVLAQADTSILQDDSLSLSATVRDTGGVVIPAATVTYLSLNGQIFSVSSAGKVNSTGRAGTAQVVASASATVKDTITITVLDSTRIVRLPLDARPTFGAAFNDLAYVSRVDVPWVKRLNLATAAFTDSVAAGSLPCGVAFNPAGTRAYVANQGSNNITIINVSNNTAIGLIPVNGNPLPVAVSLDGNTLFVTTNLNRLYKINLATNAIVDSLDLPATSHHMFVHPNDSLLYVATRDGASVLEVRWRTMTTARTFPLGVQTLGMEMAPNRSELYVTNNTNDSLYVVNLATAAVSKVFVGGGASTIALSGDGTRIYVGLLFNGKVEVLDRATKARIKTIRTGGTIRELITDAARKKIVIANDAGWVDIVR